jgi:hypothetical protein
VLTYRRLFRFSSLVAFEILLLALQFVEQVRSLRLQLLHLSKFACPLIALLRKALLFGNQLRKSKLLATKERERERESQSQSQSQS